MPENTGYARFSLHIAEKFADGSPFQAVKEARAIGCPDPIRVVNAMAANGLIVFCDEHTSVIENCEYKLAHPCRQPAD